MAQRTSTTYRCSNCRDTLNEPFCEKCKRKAPSYSHKEFPLKARLLLAQEKMGIRAREPFKGVKELINQDKIAEPLEKRTCKAKFWINHLQRWNSKVGCNQFPPLTQFKPSWIGTSIEKLKELGYSYDIEGKPLESLDQVVEIRMQDVDHSI